jgi:hypothetical protein
MSDGWLEKNYLQGYAARTTAQMSGQNEAAGAAVAAAVADE